MTCDPNHVVTKSDLNALEKHLDSVWNRLGVDIAFTKHFLDRVNDPRNERQITLCELARIFLETFRQYGKKFAHITAREWEAVLSDKTTNVNVPFILKHTGKEVEIVAKTVMRKQNFHTPDPKLVVAHRENTLKLKKLREWAGLGSPQVEPVGGMSAADDVDVNVTQIEDPEVLNMLNGFLSSLCQRQFINPYYPLHQAWMKLSAVNLSFPIRGIDLGGDSGVVYVPVSHLGGRLGQNLDGSWADNDGVSEKIPGGLTLKVEYSMVEGMYNVALQLCTDGDAVSLDPDADDEVEVDLTDIEESSSYIPSFPLKALGVNEDVQTGTSDYNTGDYPLDKTFQPTQDGETLFDQKNFESFMKKGRKIVEANNTIVVRPSSKKGFDVFVGGVHRVTKATAKGANGYASRIAKENPNLHFTPYKEVKEDYSDIQIDEAAPAQVGIYKGKKYRIKYMGQTKYGKRANLQFFDGTKDFWVDANLVQIDKSGAASHGSSTSGQFVRTSDLLSRSSSSSSTCDDCGAPGAKYPARDSSGIEGMVCARCSRLPSYELSFA